MKQKSNILVPFLLAPAFLALAARDEHPRFAPEEETSLSKRIEIASELVLDDMTMVANGQPSVRNSVFHSAKDGSLAGVREHATVGASDPFHTFQATYTKK